MKSREQVTTNGRAVFYTVLWEDFRKAALDLGWTLALHGSMANDMDIIAVPWVEDAKPVNELISALSERVGSTIWKEYHFKLTDKSYRPHGRVTYTLCIFSDYRIDLSVMPIHNNQLAKQSKL